MANFIEPYNPAWKSAFGNIKEALEGILSNIGPVNIQHVGSTAIPGLWAKPILDIDIIIENIKQLHPITAALEQAGYLHKGEQGVPGRFAFRQSSPLTPQSSSAETHWQAHHLYVCLLPSPALKNHLVFRDALLKNPQWVEAYNALKKSLTHKTGISRQEYSIQKTAFIISVLAREGFSEAELQEIKKANC